MEKWDGYLKDGRLAGCDLVRGEPVPQGLYHLVCEILVRHRDGSYLLMQRDWNKKGYPGIFEASAGGSVLKGESPYEGAARELFEETGIIGRDLTLLYGYNNQRGTFYYGYLCETDCEKTGIVLQQGETIAYRWATPEAFGEFARGTTCIAEQMARWKPFLPWGTADGV